MTNAPYAYAERPGPTPDVPTLFVFHGTGGDENQFLELGPQLVSTARVIAPRGDVSESGALRYFRRLAEGQYDMPDLERATAKMAGFVRETVDAASALTLGLGYSNGANILAAVQNAAPELFDATVLLHPLIPFDPEPVPALSGKRVLITAGRNDPICPAAATQRLADWYGAQGAVITLVWHDGGHELRQEELIAARDFLAG